MRPAEPAGVLRPYTFSFADSMGDVCRVAGDATAHPILTGMIAMSVLVGCGDSESYDSQQMTLISGPITATAVDEGKKGSSQGDPRAFTQELFGEGSDEPVGRLDGTTAITDVVERGGTTVEYRSGTIQFTLDDGNVRRRAR
jgi:hypothetical protein